MHKTTGARRHLAYLAVPCFGIVIVSEAMLCILLILCGMDPPGLPSLLFTSIPLAILLTLFADRVAGRSADRVVNDGEFTQVWDIHSRPLYVGDKVSVTGIRSVAVTGVIAKRGDEYVIDWEFGRTGGTVALSECRERVRLLSFA